MKISSMSVFLFIVSCISIWKTFDDVRKNRVGARSAIVWMSMWAGIGIFGIFPDLLNAAMAIAQMNNRMYFIIIIALFVLFAIVFSISSLVDNMQRNIRRLAQEIAILHYHIEQHYSQDK